MEDPRTSTHVEEILIYVSNCDRISPQLLVTVKDALLAFHTPLRIDILNVLIPIIYRLRNRIRAAEPAYFASAEFSAGVAGAIKTRCKELIDDRKLPAMAAGKVEPLVGQIIEAIRIIADGYKAGHVHDFEYIIERMSVILDIIDALRK